MRSRRQLAMAAFSAIALNMAVSAEESAFMEMNTGV